MQQGTRADASPADAPRVRDDLDAGQEPEIAEELLVEVIVTRAFADLATLSIVQHRASIEAQRVNEQLSAALTSRVVIEQAEGVLAGRAGVDLAEAFSRLRAYARKSNLRLTDVAEAAVAGTLDLDPLAWARGKRW